ncbi:MAG TPA: VanZ family protein [Limnochordales bacterium]|nr:VanZ family protein [Limnochordales bacterium]
MRPLPPPAGSGAAAGVSAARRRAALAWAATIAYMAVLFWLSSRPGGTVSRWNFLKLPDYVLHGAAYMGLGAVAHLAFAVSFRWPFWKRAAAALLLSAVYGVGDEFHQAFVPGRDPSWQDAAADAAGAALAQGLWWGRQARDRKRLHPTRISE